MGTSIRVLSRPPALSPRPRIPVGPRVHPHPHPPCTRAHHTPGAACALSFVPLVSAVQGGRSKRISAAASSLPQLHRRRAHPTSPVSHAAVPSRRSLLPRTCTASACYCPVIPVLRFSLRSPAHCSPPKTGVAPGLTGTRVVFARAIYCAPGRALAGSSLLSPTPRRSAPRSRHPTSQREESEESLQRGISGSIACGCSSAGSSASTSIYTATQTPRVRATAPPRLDH